jgi:MFS family permease
MYTTTLQQAKGLSTEANQTQSRLPGITLAALICLPIAGILLVAQVLPQIEASFTGAPQLRLQVSVMVTIPALAIALTSWLSGSLADRVSSKKKLLLASLGGYGVLGLAPLALHGLPAIIATRAGLGIVEGVVLTCSTALIGDLYAAEQRSGYLSLQTSLSSVAAVTFAILGGALGEFGWRAPFLVYAIAFLFVPAIWWTVPDRQKVPSPGAVSADSAVPEVTGDARLPWAVFSILCGITFVLSLCFYVPQIQTPFLLNGIGVHAPGSVGMVAGLGNAAVVVGTLFFALIKRIGIRWIAPICFLCEAAGLAIMSQSAAMVPLCTGIALASFGAGLALPTFLTTAMRLLPARQRGVGIGIWESSFWMGQFLSPVLVVPITSLTGTLPHAIAACAGAAGVFLLLLLFMGGRFLKPQEPQIALIELPS